MNIEMSKAEEEDARLTAYALGELDPADAEAVESRLKDSAESRESLEEIRSTVALLSAEFSKEPELSLHEEQVEAITGDGNIVSGSFYSRHSHWLSMGAVAACACLFAAVGMKQYIGGLERKGAVDRVQEAAEVASAPVDRGMEKPMDLDADPSVGRGGGEQKDAQKMPGAAKGQAVANAVGSKRDSPAIEPVEMPSQGVSSRPVAVSELEAEEESAPAGQVTPGKDESAARISGVRARPEDGVDREVLADAIQPMAAPVPKAVAGKMTGVVKSKESKAAVPVPVPASAPAAAPMKPMVEAEAARRKAARRPPSTSAPKTRGVVRQAVADAAPLPEGGAGATLGRAEKLAESDEMALDKAAVLTKKRRVDQAGAAGESYGQLVDNPWVRTWDDGLSTFAIDVDTGTYPNVRRFLTRRAALPPKDAVRLEEMINYFHYDYPEPDGDVPFSVNMEVASCPWAKDHRLLRVGLKGRGVDVDKRPPSNLVFLIDVSGSMRGAEKLDLLKRSMKAMVGQLNEDDRVGIVTYAGKSGVVLEPTHGDLKDKITGALDGLGAGGSTNGASGIAQAYSLAKANFVEGGTNRVILATDGDFNVGVTNSGDLIRMVEDRAGEKIFLTVLGFGQGNLQEHRMEQIADKGNGSYHYIDSEKEGEKVLVHGLGATLVTVAKDVKVQLDFNPGEVAKYRLLGYANRMLPDEAFNDPAADAGEIGAGHTVTALYEIVPTAADAKIEEGAGTGSRYRERGALVQSDELVTLKLNYKLPEDDQVAPTIEVPLVDPGKKWVDASADFRFAAAVAGFGLLLRDSDYAGLLNYDLVLELGGEGIPEEKGDPLGLRTEFLDLVKKAKSY